MTDYNRKSYTRFRLVPKWSTLHDPEQPWTAKTQCGAEKMRLLEPTAQIWMKIDPKIAVVNHPTLIWGPRQQEPLRVSAYTLYFQKLVIGLHFCRCMYGSIFIHIYASFLHQSAFCRSRSFTVIQGRWFWYQSKARIRLPISRSLWLRSYLATFLRYGDLLAKMAYFCYIFTNPLSFGALAPYVPFGILQWS